jgi:hypothetical protein
LERVIFAPHVNVRLARSEITNLGHLAERNTETMSSDQKTHLVKQHKTKRLPGQESQNEISTDAQRAQKQKKINRMSTEQKKTYIEKGTGLS